MATFKKINDFLVLISKYCSIAFYVAMLLVATLQILMRFIFKAPLAWTDEVSKYTFVWGTMLGCACLVRSGKHSTVEVLANALKGTPKKVQSIAVGVICLGLYLVIIIGGITLVKAGKTSVTPALGFPVWLIYLIMPLSGLFMALFQTERLLCDVLQKEA